MLTGKEELSKLKQRGDKDTLLGHVIHGCCTLHKLCDLRQKRQPLGASDFLGQNGKHVTELLLRLNKIIFVKSLLSQHLEHLIPFPSPSLTVLHTHQATYVTDAKADVHMRKSSGGWRQN